MKKVVYSIRKVRNSNEKLSGLGFIKGVLTLPFFMPNYILISAVKKRNKQEFIERPFQTETFRPGTVRPVLRHTFPDRLDRGDIY